MPFSDYFLDTFVAPRLSKPMTAPPYLSTVESAWVNRFIVTSVFGTSVKEPQRAHLMHLFRRAEGAIEAYREACAALPISSPNAGIFSPYFRALRQFEMCIAQAYQGYLIVRKLSGADFFVAGDLSPLDRLLGLHNISKHADERIEKGELPPHGAGLPIWLGDGLQSATVSLTYDELASVLTDLSGFCSKVLDKMTNRSADPPEGA